MDNDVQTWVWLGAGVVMLASEFVAPSLVAGFFGASAVTVAGARWLGLVESPTASVIVWALGSGAYLGLLRGVLKRSFGEPITSRDSTSEEVAAFGSIVEVVEEVGADKPGRIRWQGTTWQAHTLGPVLAPGSKARLLHRDNIGWVVEELTLPDPMLEINEPGAARKREKT